MTRIDSVRHAADVTKESVRRAAEVAAPYANTAKDTVIIYGRQAGVYGRQASVLAKQNYDAKLADRVDQVREQAWAAVPPKAVVAVETAARRTRDGAQAAVDYTAPRVGTAVAVTRSVAVPVGEEAVMRGSAAVQALRGNVSAADIDRLVRRRLFREKAGRIAVDAAFAAVACGVGLAVWRWWSSQNNPEWLVEPSEATEVGERSGMNGSATLTVVDPLDEGGSLNGSSARVDHVDGLAPDATGHGIDAERRDGEGDR
ncbi:DUF5324 family protein [Actinacidiphila yeochonensis]|uniref:DUF5324 family protein n=1 Tax=Actinacidiphila yeochonensis TaxID=89050 RepID=UPI00068AC2C1|nr:DUF5324 family protein [Actinacidiphila yeochonensis]